MKPKLDRDLIEMYEVEGRHLGYVYEVFLENSHGVSFDHWEEQYDLLWTTKPMDIHLYEDGAAFIYETEFDLKRVWELD
jgi:hypothetical protein